MCACVRACVCVCVCVYIFLYVCLLYVLSLQMTVEDWLEFEFPGCKDLAAMFVFYEQCEEIPDFWYSARVSFACTLKLTKYLIILIPDHSSSQNFSCGLVPVIYTSILAKCKVNVCVCVGVRGGGGGVRAWLCVCVCVSLSLSPSLSVYR